VEDVRLIQSLPFQKRCEKLGIPLKGRGYWSTRKHNAV
jgi:hypothetical protein